MEAARAGALALGDVDLDPDWGELVRAVGVAALEAMAVALLAAREAPAADARVVRALAPEVDAAAAPALLSLFALNVAFRLRSDATLGALVASLEAPGLPRPEASAVGRLLARARSARAARALLAAAPVAPTTREAVEAVIAPLPAPPPGARLHLDAEPDAAVRALEAALRPRRAVPWSRAGSTARRVLLLRRTGGWTTALAEDEALERDLAPHLARVAGVRRAAWSRFGPGGPDLLAVEGTRTLVDRASLEAAQGAPPDDDDVAGALRALGVLDLDPDHPRGATPLRFAEHVGGGPPLGVERRLKRRGIRALSFE
ncbi:MAG: hypothetical protein M9894_01480 [Planctomycetes bacterium]|nr:hypothetical protein [Planctomycetota bacterium]